MDEKYFKLFDRCRNLIPVMSIEGGKDETDRRRGEGIYAKLISNMDSFHEKGLLFGVSVTVTTENVREAISAAFLESLTERGCKLVVYVDILLFCLLSKYPIAKVTMGVFLIKEAVVIMIGYKVICLQGKNDGAKWYGKISTVIFYIVTIVLALFSDINAAVANVLLGFSGIAIVGAFVGYIKQYAAAIQKYRNH